MDESFVADPEDQLRAICSFLELPPAPRRLEVPTTTGRTGLAAVPMPSVRRLFARSDVIVVLSWTDIGFTLC